MCFTLTETKLKQAEAWKTHRLRMPAAGESKETSQKATAASLLLTERKKKKKATFSDQKKLLSGFRMSVVVVFFLSWFDFKSLLLFALNVLLDLMLCKLMTSHGQVTLSPCRFSEEMFGCFRRVRVHYQHTRELLSARNT